MTVRGLWIPMLFVLPICAAEIRGNAIDASGRAVVVSRAVLNSAGGANRIVAETETGGRFRFSGVRDGEYELVITATMYRDVRVRDIRVTGDSVVLPSVEMDLEGLVSCQDGNARPDYYRVAQTPTKGDLGGSVVGDNNKAVAGATMTLFRRGSGRIATAVTAENGGFWFRNLDAGPEYWISISAPGYFTDEMSGLRVQAGFSAVFVKPLESCNGCQPNLKLVRPLPSCA